MLGPCRSEYEAFSQKLRLSPQHAYLQHTPQGEQAIFYLEGNDLQRAFQELQTSQDLFAVWLRQRTQDLFDGVDLTQIDLGSLSHLVFDGFLLEEEMELAASPWPSETLAPDEESDDVRQEMERLGMISP